MFEFSVLMSVYYKEDPVNLSLSLNSLLTQTLLPKEIVLVKDGILKEELNLLIDDFVTKNKSLFKIIALQQNCGLGNALKIGLKECSYDIVARMDTDDICYPDRFEKQMNYLNEQSEVSVLGTSVQEFDQIPGDLLKFKSPPTDFSKIKSFAKFRNPINHPSVMFRKLHVINAGSYQHMPLFEDYYLWIRMICKGYIFHNLNEPLLHFRIGNDMVGRRHGVSYVKKELNFLITIKKLGFINLKEFSISIVSKIPLRLLPKKMLVLIYKMFLR